MPTASALLIIGGTLLLSPSHPAHFSRSAGELWFSNGQRLEAQSLGHGVVLRAKERGVVHAVGLRAAQEAPQRILVTSDANYQAFRRCPQASLDLNFSPPRAAAPGGKLDPKLAACGFDEMSLDLNAAQTNAAEFARAETELAARGTRVLAAEWREGVRLLVVGQGGARVRGPLAPYFSYEERALPRPGRTLIFEVTLFEISKSELRELGVAWPRALGLKGTLRPAGLELPSVTDLAAKFSESKGLGKILAQPQIRTMPGQKASFQSGGEIPIRNSSLTSSSTSWKSYGLMLQLEPDANLATGAPEIAVNFKVELSEPDFGMAINGVPGMLLRKLESRFELRVNETTILTTMVQSREGTRREGLPGLFSLPIINNLFSDQLRHSEGSELCFSVRPTWDESLAPSSQFPTRNVSATKF